MGRRAAAADPATTCLKRMPPVLDHDYVVFYHLQSDHERGLTIESELLQRKPSTPPNREYTTKIEENKKQL